MALPARERATRKITPSIPRSGPKPRMESIAHYMDKMSNKL